MHEELVAKKRMNGGSCMVGLLLGLLGGACGSSPEPAPEAPPEEVAPEPVEAPVTEESEAQNELAGRAASRIRAMEGLGPLRFGMSREEAMSWVEPHPVFSAMTVPYDLGFEDDRLTRIELLPHFLKQDVFVAGTKIEPGMNREFVARVLGDCGELQIAEGGNHQVCRGGLIHLSEAPGNSADEPFRQDVGIEIRGEALGPAVLRMSLRGTAEPGVRRTAEVQFDAGDVPVVDAEFSLDPGLSTVAQGGIGGVATVHAGRGEELFALRQGDEVRLYRRTVSEDFVPDTGRHVQTFVLPAHRTLKVEAGPNSVLDCSGHREVARCGDGPRVCVSSAGVRMSVDGPDGRATYDAPLDRLLRYSYASPQNSRSALRVGLPTPWHFLVGPDGELSVERGEDDVPCEAGEHHMEVFVGLLSADETSFPY